jgi:DNA polymerase-1
MNPIQCEAQKKIFLIDGSSILYRGYYGVRPLHTSKGTPVQAVYNFCRMIKKLLNQFDPAYIAIVWDSKGKTTRHTLYADYKATRQAPPSDLFEQKEYIIKFANLIGIKQVAQTGIEADDLMFSIAREQTKKEHCAIFVTSDKDMGQAINDKILLYDPLKDILYDQATFEKKMEIPIHKLPFYYALIGDTSDNIPGVRGVGEKTAHDLVNQFDSLENLYKNLNSIKTGRVRNALENNKENAFLSLDLFLLQYHKTDVSLNDMAFNKENWVNALPLFKELEFTSLITPEIADTKKEMATTISAIIEHIESTYTFSLVTTHTQLQDLATRIKQAQQCAFDTETDGLRAMEVNLVGISLSFNTTEAFYIPCGHQTDEEQLSLDDIVQILKPVLEDPAVKKYGHNVKFDQHVLASHGINVRGIDFDSCIAASLLKKNWQSAGLKESTEYYFNEPMLTYEQLTKETKYKDFSYVPLKIALYYAANDALQTFKLTQVLKKELEKNNLTQLYNEIEFPLIEILYTMEQTGIYCDIAMLKTLAQKIDTGLEIIRHALLELIGPEHQNINFNSPKQIQVLLFDTLQLTPLKKNAKGEGHSTDQEVLSQLAKEHPVPGLLIKYRELFKLKTTYVEALPTYVNKKTGRIHTTFSQIRAATGRLASSEPNLQNIPADGTSYGAALRETFKPTDDNIYISADYSQIELRVLAHLSQDSNLINAFLAEHDIHAETSARLFDVALDAVTHEQRQLGKRINFSILYGLTPYGLSKDLDISLKDAKLYIDKYFAQYPAVSSWMESVIADTQKNGYTTTFWGRKRDLPTIYEKNKTLHEEAKRIAVNTVAQGTAAEIMKKGMINLSTAFKKENIDAHLLLQIHDELLISVPRAQQQQAEQLIKQVLENVVAWSVPLVVTMRVGNNWKEVSK